MKTPLRTWMSQSQMMTSCSMLTLTRRNKQELILQRMNRFLEAVIMRRTSMASK